MVRILNMEQGIIACVVIPIFFLSVEEEACTGGLFSRQRRGTFS
jgi:hypothetical protein